MICFSTLGGTLEVKSRSDFPKSHQEINVHRCHTIKFIETSKYEMLNIEKAFIRSVDTSPEKVIFVALNQLLTDLAGHLRHIGSYNL